MNGALVSVGPRGLPCPAKLRRGRLACILSRGTARRARLGVTPDKGTARRAPTGPRRNKVRHPRGASACDTILTSPTPRGGEAAGSPVKGGPGPFKKNRFTASNRLDMFAPNREEGVM